MLKSICSTTELGVSRQEMCSAFMPVKRPLTGYAVG